MRASRFKGNHHNYNNSVFSHGERIEQAREKARQQTFQYRDGDSLVTSGPVIKMGFFTDDGEDVKHLDKPGIEYEMGDRIYKTDPKGCISVANTSWLRDC